MPDDLCVVLILDRNHTPIENVMDIWGEFVTYVRDPQNASKWNEYHVRTLVADCTDPYSDDFKKYLPPHALFAQVRICRDCRHVNTKVLNDRTTCHEIVRFLEDIISKPRGLFLTRNPTITFFPVVYRRYTRFAVESISVPEPNNAEMEILSRQLMNLFPAELAGVD